MSGPHSSQNLAGAKPIFTARLFDHLWEQYRDRVEYVRTYERVIEEAGASFFNDHIAFRTIAWQQPFAGISILSRIFESLDYRPAGAYAFPDKRLSAIHLEPPDASLPKLFISELRAAELPDEAQEILDQSLQGHREPPSRSLLTTLSRLSGDSPEANAPLLADVASWFLTTPWESPEQASVEALNQHSQYGAWVLLHGYRVNHFTALIDSHGVESLDDIEKTAAALKAAGVPMKDSIEGERGAALRQTATEAVTIDVPVRRDGRETTMPWTYAYFELAERPARPNHAGNLVRYEGFLGSQATELFEMTRRQQ